MSRRLASSASISSFFLVMAVMHLRPAMHSRRITSNCPRARRVSFSRSTCPQTPTAQVSASLPNAWSRMLGAAEAGGQDRMQSCARERKTEQVQEMQIIAHRRHVHERSRYAPQSKTCQAMAGPSISFSGSVIGSPCALDANDECVERTSLVASSASHGRSWELVIRSPAALGHRDCIRKSGGSCGKRVHVSWQSMVLPVAWCSCGAFSSQREGSAVHAARGMRHAAGHTLLLQIRLSPVSVSVSVSVAVAVSVCCRPQCAKRAGV